MTKEKLEWIIKRLSYIIKMLRNGETEKIVYISKHKEKIEIDDDVLAVIEIMEEIIRSEKVPWRKKVLTEIRNGVSDMKIIRDNPIGRTKYYMEKNAFTEKIYQCCIFKGMVGYDNILMS